MIKTERLQIRRIKEDDWKGILRIWQNFSASAFAQYDTPHPTDEETVHRKIARWAQFADSTEHMFFAVCLEETLIGYVAFNIREDSHEVGYCFHSAYHAKGYAKESLSALLAHMRALGAKKISAGTALNNTPSVRLLKSLGFEQTGEEQVSFYQNADGSDIFFDGGIFELAL